ncbi:hypothetical protein CRU87_09440 [Aliarcobacter trophiarum LMG 25534]|uniref:Uncharacterized protein n=1 Tax=Aliarcobacter trophiarum LMG 25534 TaxID=1032241 RepID=A0ABY0EXJ5_9BACT|nr:hypothetical protein [Aliarcobacter trophiarum]RXJ89322.1 hypothetical protein CRU87_09440 [Aliarcobacter trophiarum LMG 25534]
MKKFLEFKNEIFFILFLLLIFFVNISFKYIDFQNFKEETVFVSKATILKIYKKEKFDILKLKGEGFEFFGTISKNEELDILDYIELAIDTREVDFLNYLKGFFTKILYFDRLDKKYSVKEKIVKNIEENHDDLMIKELFNALFLAIPVSSELRDVITAYRVAHVVALSGFHWNDPKSVDTFLIS